MSRRQAIISHREGQLPCEYSPCTSLYLILEIVEALFGKIKRVTKDVRAVVEEHP
jgi:hypothetical protein